MRLYFETEQWLPYPTELVFAFFANPENLPRLMPPWQRARIEEAVFAPSPPRPTDSPRYPGIAAGNGTLLTIGFRPFPFAPFRIPWEARIEDFRWNEGFCDVQLRGPFKYWRHCHTVTPAPNPSTHIENPGVTPQSPSTLTPNPGAPGPDSRTRVDQATTNPGNLGTLLTDHLTYELPLGPLSTLANTLAVRHALAATFRYRQQRTTELLTRATTRPK